VRARSIDDPPRERSIRSLKLDPFR
jgi:hypothetical protein